MNTCHCDNCQWCGDTHGLHRVDDLYERVEPGDIMPAGQCPACAALVYPDEQPTHGFSLGDTKLRYQEVDEGLYVHVDNVKRNYRLTFKFTGEGLILDLLNEDAEIEESFARMYDELNDVDIGL